MFTRMLLCLCILSSVSLWATEAARSSLKSGFRRGDIHKPQGLWTLLGVGMGVMDASEDMRTGGVPAHAKILGSYYFDGTPWVVDGGVGLHNEFLTQEGSGSDTIQSVYTEVAARYELTNKWQLGAIWNTLVDSPDRYNSNTEDLASFIGVQVLKEFSWGDKYLVRAGGRAMTDVGISGETINTVMGEVQVSFGDHRPSPLVQTKPVELKREPAPLAPHLARQAVQTIQIEPGPVHFESDSVQLMSTSQPYIRRLARALASNRQLFERIEVVGHSDQRGTEAYNIRLSRHRAETVAHSLIAAGLNKAQIETVGRGKSELLTQAVTPAGMARNRRVELRFAGVKNQAALKNVIDSVKR